MEAYLDNSATTKVFEPVANLMMEVMEVDFGNPSSKHIKGMEAEQYIREARQVLAKNMKCKDKEILFTSGGTESNNMALIGTALANKRRGKHIITTCFEHPSVHEPLIFLEDNGFEVTYLTVDEQGHVPMELLQGALREDTILVSVMLVNNEVGAVQDVAAMAKVIKEYNKDIVFHVDAIQAYGKYKLYPGRLGIDLMSVSGHKIHGPKGIGFLYIKEGTKINPIIFGGGQQSAMRSGTENVPGIAGLGKAVTMIYDGFEDKIKNMYENKAYFIQEIIQLEGVTVNACDGVVEDTAPHIISVSVAGIKSEVLLHALEDKGIYVSSGSACSSNHPGISGTLQAIGVDRDLLDSTLRFSLCETTSKEELTYAVDTVRELLPMLRRFVRK